MKIQISGNIELNIHIDNQKTSTEACPVIFLHGFSGSSSDWLSVFNKLPQRFSPVALDFIGHGKSSLPEEVFYYTAESIVMQLDQLFNILGFKEIILLGYSMGGRAALSYAAKFPKKVKALILESATPGIKDDQERLNRIKSDEDLARFIENNSLEKFADRWINLPLFDSQKKLPLEIIEKSRNSKLNNSQKGLANSLRGFSTGQMPQLWDSLMELNMKVLIITGSLDEKFTKIGSLMHEKLPESRHVIIQDAGHNIHLEKPEVFLNLLMDFLDQI
ncbi:MAG: 2-succinyl-6-hydroxy-2,4-cyclohexadiene-1-carboxylate synthase [Bacillota bacterium]